MKKLRSLVIALMTGMLLVSCGQKDSKVEESAEDTNVIEEKQEEKEEVKEEFKAEVKEEVKEEFKRPLTAGELDAELAKLPMIITHTEYIVQDVEFKALYPDVLNTVFQNNSGTDVKNVVIGLAAWDQNNFPVKIEGQFSFESDYYLTVEYPDVNMINGATFGEDSGLLLSEDNNISKFKAIVVSYTDFEGKTWNNEFVDEFKELYVNKKLVE